MNKAILPITIRKANTQDAGCLSELSKEAFQRSYPYSYDQPDMDAYLKKHLSEKKIIEDLKVPTIHYYIAETETIVGLVKFNTCMWTPRFKGRLTFEVERLYIQKDMEGKKIGSRLMSKTIEEGQLKNYTIIWLSVWEKNVRAISFHKRHGFTIIGDGVFRMGKSDLKYLVMQLK